MCGYCGRGVIFVHVWWWRYLSGRLLWIVGPMRLIGPGVIRKWTDTLSCDKGTFDAAAPEYNEALIRRSDFNAQLTYQPPNANTNTRRSRSRNVIWYNPPFSKNVKTSIAHKFLQLIDKHFPPSNKLSKLFNKHTVRVSYSCNENMRSFISRHNKAVLKSHTH